MGYKIFPDAADWARCFSASQFQPILDLARNFRFSQPKTLEPKAFANAIRLDGFAYEMNQRLSDAATAFVLTMFYYDQGIPDRRWRESPSKDGHSVGYFPDFSDHHFKLKAWFDFYADTFYFKLFSAWDLVGHLIDRRYNLNAKNPDFSRALNALEKKNEIMRDAWRPIVDDPQFIEAKRIRNDIAHNYLPGTTGMSVTEHESVVKGRRRTEYAFGLKKYMPSDEVVKNARAAIKLFQESLVILKAS